MSSETKSSTPAKTGCSGGACKPNSKEGWKAGQNGKGSAPRNISTTFRSNYESINWGKK